MSEKKPNVATGPDRDAPHASPAPGSSTPLHTIPDEEADRVVPRDPGETKARDPASEPYPPEHDGPDSSGNRPRPL